MATKKEMMVAREACVVTVGARPIEYAKIRTYDKHSEKWVEIDNQMDVVDPGDDGISYTFKKFQKVSPNHEAVKDAPSAFMPFSEIDETDAELVT